MRHHIVTRIVIALAALWTAAVVIFAWDATRGRAPASAAFREFLADHYGPSPEGSVAIVACV